MQAANNESFFFLSFMFFTAEPNEFNSLVEKACDSVDQSRGDYYGSKVTVFRHGEKIDEMEQSLETDVIEEAKY